MSEAIRTARLTVIAQRVWPAHRVCVEHYAGAAWVRVTGGGILLQVFEHPRALDALESVLLMLAGETPQWARELASEWDQRAYKVRDRMPEAVAAFEECASELRERSRGSI